MSGFDNGTIQGGVFFQTKQFGPVIRGSGPPVPRTGVVGDLYIDTVTSYLYEKRSVDGNLDPWGHYLFQVPAPYDAKLKWFATTPPDSTIGAVGDYFLLWGGYPNYGMQPTIYGPKALNGWPANGVAVAVVLNPLYTATDTHDI